MINLVINILLNTTSGICTQQYVGAQLDFSLHWWMKRNDEKWKRFFFSIWTFLIWDKNFECFTLFWHAKNDHDSLIVWLMSDFLNIGCRTMQTHVQSFVECITTKSVAVEQFFYGYCKHFVTLLESSQNCKSSQNEQWNKKLENFGIYTLQTNRLISIVRAFYSRNLSTFSFHASTSCIAFCYNFLRISYCAWKFMDVQCSDSEFDASIYDNTFEIIVKENSKRTEIETEHDWLIAGKSHKFKMGAFAFQWWTHKIIMKRVFNIVHQSSLWQTVAVSCL